jgi:hypothetical protein
VRSSSKKKPGLLISNNTTISPPATVGPVAKRVNGFFRNVQNLEINGVSQAQVLRSKQEAMRTASSRAQSLTPRNVANKVQKQPKFKPSPITKGKIF